MTVDVVSRIEIDAPVVDVATYSENPDNVPNWYVNIKSVEWKTSPPLAVGSKIAFVAHFLGRRLAYTYEVVDYSPGTNLVMRTSEGPFPMETSYVWQPIAGDRTHMTLRNRGEPTGFSKLTAPFMASMMRRANTKDLQLLKRILEKRDA